MKTLFAILTTVMLFVNSNAGTLDKTVLRVDGEPFYPVGTWGGDPEHCASMGMNTILMGVPKDAEGIESFRGQMHRCAELGIQVVPFLGFGGANPDAWTPEEVRRAAVLANEPNLLAWYLGDDVYETGLVGVRETADLLAELTPDIPKTADYIGDFSNELARDVYGNHLDINASYSYPVPGDDPANDPSLLNYFAFFDTLLVAMGEPRWTTLQCFQWNRHSDRYNLGHGDGTGAIPEPEQLRIMGYTAIERGVRGLLLWPHRTLPNQPEHAAEYALLAHETQLVGSHLAAGIRTPDIHTSDTNIRASAYTYGGSSVITSVLVKPSYNRWVDAGIIEDLVIEIPWEKESKVSEIPRAVLINTPDLISCGVELTERGTARITLSSFELAGFVLVSANDAEIELLRTRMKDVSNSISSLIVPAAAAQMTESNGVLRQAGRGTPGESATLLAQCAEASVEGRHDDALRSWRGVLRSSRSAIDDMMLRLERSRSEFTPSEQVYLESPHALHNIRGLANAISPEDPWHFVRTWSVVGPFPLGWKGDFIAGDSHRPVAAPGFDNAFPPESDPLAPGPFETMDGPALWKDAGTDVSGMIDLTKVFATTDTAISYLQTIVIAPEPMDVEMSLGSNDGAKVLVNGTEMFSVYCARTSSPHQDTFRASLRAGRNVVTVKAVNLALGWQVYLSIQDPERRLEYATQ
jgi:hypothetical protein